MPRVVLGGSGSGLEYSFVPQVFGSSVPAGTVGFVTVVYVPIGLPRFDSRPVTGASVNFRTHTEKKEQKLK